MDILDSPVQACFPLFYYSPVTSYQSHSLHFGHPFRAVGEQSCIIFSGFICVLLTLGLVPRLRDVICGSLRGFRVSLNRTIKTISRTKASRSCGTNLRVSKTQSFFTIHPSPFWTPVLHILDIPCAELVFRCSALALREVF